MPRKGFSPYWNLLPLQRQKVNEHFDVRQALEEERIARENLSRTCAVADSVAEYEDAWTTAYNRTNATRNRVALTF